MRDPELVARAGYAAARLEQAWERWRALHGLGGSSDPLASYVGYSLKEPMGQPRVVIGVDAAEAEYFAEFLESHDCAGLGHTEPRPVNGMAHLTANGSAPALRDVPSEPPARMADPTAPGMLTGRERTVMTGSGPMPAAGSGSMPASATRVFHQPPVAQGRPRDPSGPLAAELAGWASGELPGQASEQMATWSAAEPASPRAMGRPRSAR